VDSSVVRVELKKTVAVNAQPLIIDESPQLLWAESAAIGKLDVKMFDTLERCLSLCLIAGLRKPIVAEFIPSEFLIFWAN